MAGSTFGTIFRITTWGESHGPAVGVVIDGCPAGLSLCEADIQTFLDRRKPGQNRFTTPRKESDQVEILSGVFEGKTTGTALSLLIRNQDQISKDYDNIKDCYRPGHADYTFDRKYGFRDYRGGGRSSGRETIGRVAAGAVASLLLQQLEITVTAYTKSIGPVCVPENAYDLTEIPNNALYMPNARYAAEAVTYLEDCIQKEDSSGGIVECVIHGMPAGIGEPVFEKLDAKLTQAVMSIGSVKGVEIGDGFGVTNANGSTNNDSFYADDLGQIKKKTNHAGGILGGISDGGSILLRAAIKPTPSIAQTQHTVTRTGENVDISIHGRHDPVIVPRAVVIVESMVAIATLDLMMVNMSARLDNLKKFYL